jgi:hypothetical protein
MNKDVRMKSLRQELASILAALGLPPSSRRSTTTPASPACESLEGRQLLTGGMGSSGMGFGGMGFGGPADVTSIGGGFNASSTSGSGETGFSSDVSNFGPGAGEADLFGGDSGGSDSTPPGISTQAATMGGQGGNFSNSSVSDSSNASGFSNFSPEGLFGGMSTQAAGMGGQFSRSTSPGVSDISNSGNLPSFGPGDGGSVASNSLGFSNPDEGMSGPIDNSANATASDATNYLELQYSGMALGGGPGGGGVLGGGPGFGGQGPMNSGSGTTTSNTQLQTDLQKLQTDEQTIQGQSEVTPAMMAKVETDLNAVKAAETTTPDSSTLATLQTDLTTAQNNTGGPTAAQLAQVQTDQDAVYESQGVSTSLVDQLDTDLATIQTASGITAADQATIAADQAAITADQANLGGTTSTSTTPSTPSTTSTTTSST